ncbi:hypothetical protein TorRG33x02_193410 [Trema orientale]|uniref:Uncharacterized protein n=1 Tax=Trema orientale TaxID=63057 RepID=A0A2P5EGX6_TREOI|nr:hypothetical protein TorRG33x02_193410 [Trema orientale]
MSKGKAEEFLIQALDRPGWCSSLPSFKQRLRTQRIQYAEILAFEAFTLPLAIECESLALHAGDNRDGILTPKLERGNLIAIWSASLLRVVMTEESVVDAHVYNVKSGCEKEHEINLFGEIVGISSSADPKSLFIGVGILLTLVSLSVVGIGTSLV